MLCSLKRPLAYIYITSLLLTLTGSVKCVESGGRMDPSCEDKGDDSLAVPQVCGSDTSNDDISVASYGCDVSFPMHHHNFSTAAGDRPYGDVQEKFYSNFMKGCRAAFPDIADQCNVFEQDRIEVNLAQPATVENYTDTGYHKIRAPQKVWELMKGFWDANHGKEIEEDWDPADIFTNHWESPCYLIDFGNGTLEGGGGQILSDIHAASKQVLEEWSGKELVPTYVYGIRSYTEGAVLSPHVDGARRVVSAIVNVAQDVDEPWMLEVIDHSGRAVNITMEPGDMVFYESRSVIHGRPYPLKGRFFANAFIHFEPVGYPRDYDEEEAEDAVERAAWERRQAQEKAEAENEVVDEDELVEDDQKYSYGVDVSWPHHYATFREVDWPLGNPQEEVYNKFMKGCKEANSDAPHECDEGEDERLESNLKQPATVENYTDTGYAKIRAPLDMMEILNKFFQDNQGRETDEDWGKADIFVNHWEATCWMLDLGDGDLEGGGGQILDKLFALAKPLLEEWSGQKLVATNLYGIRSYTEGAILNPHVDGARRVVSAIVNVAQDVDEPWPLEVIDHNGRAVNVTMEPGDLVFYESRSILHGRPYPLRGRFFANIFIHFEPEGYPRDYEEEAAEERSEEASMERIRNRAAAEEEEWEYDDDFGDVVVAEYGTDVSFPMHHKGFSSDHRPFGDVQEKVYAEHMQGCRDAFPDIADQCDTYEDGRIRTNLEQPVSLENYTETGYKKIRVPTEIWDLVEPFWDKNQEWEYEEDLGKADIYMNGWTAPAYMMDIGDDRLDGGGGDVVDRINEIAKPLLEEWSGQELVPTYLYGIRTYTTGAILSPHVDGARRVISAIVNVAQHLDEPWILEVIDHQGRAVNITMDPGDMVLYESRTLIHGRPYPLRGEYFSNMFLHFEPVGYERDFEEEESEERFSRTLNNGLNIVDNWDDEVVNDVVEGSYGVDCSFPMHHSTFSTLDRPAFSSSQEVVYEKHMRGCRETFPDVAEECDSGENERIQTNLNQPASVENYTDTGYKKVRVPSDIWVMIKLFWDKNQHAEYEEDLGEADIYMNGWIAPAYMVDIGDDELDGGGEEVIKRINELAKPLLEEWSGQELEPIVLYGIRTYTEGAILSPHVDGARRVISAIVNVDQDVEEPWVLEVIDHSGKAVNITMEPGDMVFYESRSIIHGRPYPLVGNSFSNLFLHFEPVGYERNYEEEAAEDRANAKLEPGKSRYQRSDEKAADEKVEQEEKVQSEKIEEETVETYGCDVSWPMHHPTFSDQYRLPGKTQEGVYADYMQGCRDAFPHVAARCDSDELDRIRMNFEQPASLDNYTGTGYKKIRAPPRMWSILEKFWEKNHQAQYLEDWDEAEIYINHWKAPAYMVDLGNDELEGGGEATMNEINQLAKELLEEWSGQKLIPTFLYGIRTYTEGAILIPHVDGERRVVSAIVNVAQDVEEPWILEVIDHHGTAVNVTMDPGDMVFYESRTLIHGRPFPLKGKSFSNVFIHFEPEGYVEKYFE